MAGKRVIGVDLGGTKILAGLLDEHGSVLRRREWPTPKESEDALVRGIEQAVVELQEDDVAAIGIGVPSAIDQSTGTAVGSVNIPLAGFPLRDHVSTRFGLPVEVENDGNAAALGEWANGAGRGTSTLVMLTLGTGVGGGVVLDGRLFRGWAELGHMVIEHDGKPCQGACTGRGHIEAYCTGLAAGEAARDAFGPAADAHRLVRLAREGERRAVEILTDVGRRLGSGIGSLVNVFHPDVVVVGGGFGAAAGDFLLAPAREVAVREALPAAKDGVRIVGPALGTAAGLVGAGLVALHALEPG
jgi:glucokinase